MPDRYGADMATAVIIPPAIFVQHAAKLRARKLEQVATQVEQEMQLRLVALERHAREPRKDISSVLKQFRGKLR